MDPAGSGGTIGNCAPMALKSASASAGAGAVNGNGIVPGVAPGSGPMSASSPGTTVARNDHVVPANCGRPEGGDGAIVGSPAGRNNTRVSSAAPVQRCGNARIES